LGRQGIDELGESHGRERAGSWCPDACRRGIPKQLRPREHPSPGSYPISDPKSGVITREPGPSLFRKGIRCFSRPLPKRKPTTSTSRLSHSTECRPSYSKLGSRSPSTLAPKLTHDFLPQARSPLRAARCHDSRGCTELGGASETHVRQSAMMGDGRARPGHDKTRRLRKAPQDYEV
jgi:hypothetical protein